MRVPTDLSSPLVGYHSRYNSPPYWPNWYPGSEWAERHAALFLGQDFYAAHWHWSIAAATLYLAAIWAGQKLMENRKPFELRWSLFAWNATMSLFSALGTYIYLPHVLHALWTYGYQEMVCGIPEHGVFHVLLWAQIFAWSKLIEFGDTAFLVLRRRPVIPLHWIHHALTCVISFYAQVRIPSILLQIGTINFAVHTVMYAYYSARASGLRVPTHWAKWITRAQIAQMLVNFGSVCAAYWITEHTARPCNGDPLFMYFGCVLFGLFTFLFVRYFVRAYSKSRDSQLNGTASRSRQEPPTYVHKDYNQNNSTGQTTDCNGNSTQKTACSGTQQSNRFKTD